MKYLIWNFERSMYWKANSRGYTPERSDAGLYSERNANDICLQANLFIENPNEQLNEAMIPVPERFKSALSNKLIDIIK